MKKKKTTVGTISISNRIIVETDKINTHDTSGVPIIGNID
jgi:hypothetical protein